MDCGIIPVRNQSWDDNPGLFDFENGLGLSHNLLDVGYVASFTADFLNSGGDSNLYIGCPFHHFGLFFIFNSFDEGI
jgi:hypothetical protein